MNQLTSALFNESAKIRSLEAKTNLDHDGALTEMTMDARDKKQREKLAAARRRISGAVSTASPIWATNVRGHHVPERTVRPREPESANLIQMFKPALKMLGVGTGGELCIRIHWSTDIVPEFIRTITSAISALARRGAPMRNLLHENPSSETPRAFDWNHGCIIFQ